MERACDGTSRDVTLCTPCVEKSITNGPAGLRAPGAVLGGGTATAYHARHRVLLDDDHFDDDRVVAEQRTRFDEVLTALLAALEETEIRYGTLALWRAL